MQKKIIHIAIIAAAAITIIYAGWIFLLIFSLKVDYDEKKFTDYMNRVEKKLEKRQQLAKGENAYKHYIKAATELNSQLAKADKFGNCCKFYNEKFCMPHQVEKFRNNVIFKQHREIYPNKFIDEVRIGYETKNFEYPYEYKVTEDYPNFNITNGTGFEKSNFFFIAPDWGYKQTFESKKLFILGDFLYYSALSDFEKGHIDKAIDYCLWSQRIFAEAEDNYTIQQTYDFVYIQTYEPMLSYLIHRILLEKKLSYDQLDRLKHGLLYTCGKEDVFEDFLDRSMFKEDQIYNLRFDRNKNKQYDILRHLSIKKNYLLFNKNLLVPWKIAVKSMRDENRKWFLQHKKKSAKKIEKHLYLKHLSKSCMPFRDTFLTNVEYYQLNFYGIKTIKNGLIILCALDQYKIEKGTYPDTLSQLTPKHLKNIPEDLFAADGKFKYSKTGDKIVFYSVGADGSDDNGEGDNEYVFGLRFHDDTQIDDITFIKTINNKSGVEVDPDLIKEIKKKSALKTGFPH